MHIFRALDQLLHVKLDLTGTQLDAFVLEKASEVVVHVRKDHEHGKRFFAVA